MLTRLHVKGYKSLADVEVRLPELALLMGPNAAGKSNFLDCLQLLSKLTTSRTLKDAFEPPYRGKPLESFTFGPGGVRGSLSKETLSFSIEADIRLSRQVIDAVNRQVRDMRRTNPNDPEAGDETKRRFAKNICGTESSWKCCRVPGFYESPTSPSQPSIRRASQ